MKYSIILSTYNWPQALGLILDSLLPQLESHPDVELLIADDGSKEDTGSIIFQYQYKLRGRIDHIWHKDEGFRKGGILNKAVAVAKGDYLMFLDGDCIPFPDYIDQHKSLAQRGYFVAGNRVLLSKEFTKTLLDEPSLINQIFSWRMKTWLWARITKRVNKIFPFWRFNPQAKWRYLRSRNWKYPKGCNFGIFKSDFAAVNGFDEVFCGWGHEDADLFIRLRHNKLKIKDGRFALPVLHLWHKEASRIWESNNSWRLMKCKENKKRIKAEDGLDKHPGRDK